MDVIIRGQSEVRMAKGEGGATSERESEWVVAGEPRGRYRVNDESLP